MGIGKKEQGATTVSTDIDQLDGNTIDLGAGSVGSGTARVVLASDDPAVASLGILDDWDATEDSAVGADGVIAMVEAKSSQKTAVDDGDAVIPVYNLNGEQVNAGYTWLTDSSRVEEVDPVSQHYVGDKPASVTGQTNGTFEYYVDMAGYRYLSVQWDETAGIAGDNTLTVEATCRDDGTAPGSCEYTDVTNAIFGVASLTADGMLHPDKKLVCKYAKITVVRANDGGNNDGAWDIWIKKLY